MILKRGIIFSQPRVIGGGHSCGVVSAVEVRDVQVCRTMMMIGCYQISTLDGIQ